MAPLSYFGRISGRVEYYQSYILRLFSLCYRLANRPKDLGQHRIMELDNLTAVFNLPLSVQAMDEYDMLCRVTYRKYHACIYSSTSTDRWYIFHMEQCNLQFQQVLQTSFPTSTSAANIYFLGFGSSQSASRD
jgi:hypothetical protein